MQPGRRDFLKYAGVLSATAVGLGGIRKAAASAADPAPDHVEQLPPETMGVLVDLNNCIGCRLCEYACKKANGLPTGSLESYDDQSVMVRQRRPSPDALTVVNRFQPSTARGQHSNPVFVKINCMHCNHCACGSACIVGALRKQTNGAVTYDEWKCIGCRYCMVACPFQLPAYTYDEPLTPRIMKCQFCFTRTSKGERPACVDACPRETLTFGRRQDLIRLAHERISANPSRYVNHVYGEKEVGGTSWMYLSPVSFEKIGLPAFGDKAPSALTEKIQHGVFKPDNGAPPLLLYGVLGGLMWMTNRRNGSNGHTDIEAAAAVSQRPAHAQHHEEAAPVQRKLLTPGVLVLLALMTLGAIATAYRFIFGLQASTNLDQQHPWGLWIAIDVASGVALAAGGFTSAFLAHVLNREKYHAIVRPALLTAMLGYTFVCLGLQADLGRYYNVWHPMFMWNGNSVLFEVGMCVMCYLNVLYLEFAPIVCERLVKPDIRSRFPKVSQLAAWMQKKLDRIMFLLIIAGCVLSCLHQSSLGNLMVIAQYKLHPLWWTPISALAFLLSAFMVGFPMVIWESLFAGWSLKLKPEMDVLSSLARFIPITAGVYLAVRIGDMIVRGTYVYLSDGTLQSSMWLVEMGFGVALPWLMLMSPKLRKRPIPLFTAVTLIILGVVLNRIDVFLVGYKPPFEQKSYFPSLAEFAVTIGLGAALMFLYRVAVTYLPIISQPAPLTTEEP